MDVQARRYRFRVVNGSNARFYSMSSSIRRASTCTRTARGSGDLADRIGRRLLQQPGQLTNPANGIHACDGLNNADAGNVLGGANDIQAGKKCLFLAPAERADIIIDFGGQLGKTFTHEELRGHSVPQRRPGRLRRAGRHVDGLVMQFRVSQPSATSVDTSFNPAGAHPALRASPMVNVKPANGRGDKLRQLILVEEEGNTADVDGPGSPDGDGEPVESLVNNTKWNGNREGTTTMVPGSTSNGRGDLGDRDAARGLDRGLGGRQPDRRRAPDPHPPDPVPGDLAPAV